MKIVSLKKIAKPIADCRIKNLLTNALLKDIDTFKSTMRQFLRNNQNYLPAGSGLSA